MESTEHSFSLSPARFIFLAFIHALLAIGILSVLFLTKIRNPAVWAAGGAVSLLLLGLGTIALLYRVFHSQPVLIVHPKGLRINFTGLGKLVNVPWENVLYAKYYALSIDQQGLGIALKNPEIWMNRLSLPEKALSKIMTITGKATINIQQNIVREPLSIAVELIGQYVEFDDELIYRLEHPEKKKTSRNRIA